ncbi:beta-lactamase/transpeptidase-like protein [Peniophora sp. CONT]|nr:beta-lactamase/transpeptidase-like protein [Peniophora sp. CONT]
MPAAKISDAGLARLKELVKDYGTETDKPGTAVGIVSSDGSMLFNAAVGPSDITTQKPMTQDQVFWIASCTKIVTAIACMQLVERGKLSLHDPLGTLCPELADPEIIVASTSTSIETKKAQNKITLHHLLTHSAGYSYSWYSEHIKNWSDINKVDEFSGTRRLMPLIFEPGTRYSYGINMDWAGLVVEAATGMKLGDYMEQNIFAPLGVKDICFDLSKRPDMKARLAPLHAWNKEEGTFGPREHTPLAGTPQIHGGGGGLFSTVADYLQVLVVLLNEGKGANGTRLLKEDTVKMMWKDQLSEIKQTISQPADVSDSKYAGEPLALGENKGWGYSMLLNETKLPTGRTPGSGEWGGISNLVWMADATKGFAYLIANCILPYGVPRFHHLADEVEKTVYDNLE